MAGLRAPHFLPKYRLKGSKQLQNAKEDSLTVYSESSHAM